MNERFRRRTSSTAAGEDDEDHPSGSSDSPSSLVVAEEKSPLVVGAVVMMNPPSKNAMTSQQIPVFVWKATAIASLGGILFGYDMGVISGALPQLSLTFSLTPNQQQLIVGILYFGGGLGATVGGTLCDYLGRKTAILVTDVFFLVGAAILSLATTITHLLVGRIVMGFAIAVSGIADVAYLNEMAPVEWRGSIVSVNEACISLGFLLAYLAGFVLEHRENGWRGMFGVSGIVAMIQWIGMMYMPESPLWLQERGRFSERQAALQTIYGNDQALPIEESIEEEQDQSYERLEKANVVSTSSWVERIRRTCALVWSTVCRYDKQVWIALFLSVAQQMSGQTSVLNYAPLIFRQFDNNSTMASTLYIGLVKFGVTCLVIWKIESLGRKFLLQVGMSIIIVGLLLLAFAFVGTNDDNNGENGGTGNTGIALALPGVLFVVMGYSASFGPLTWLLTAELFPTNIRGRALGGSTIVTYACACLVTSTFLSAQTILGASRVFFLHAVITLFGLFFSLVAIPDTGGKSVSLIQDDLDTMWWWRRRRRQRNNHEADDTTGSALTFQTTSVESGADMGKPNFLV